jgi:hypothetical protein
MPRNRTPTARALTAGANLKNPKRYRDRKRPANTQPIGDPPASLTPVERVFWEECRANLPWLHRAHRLLLQMTCKLAARMDDHEHPMGVNAHQALSSMLSKLGATPVDESRVSHADDDDEDPAERFFN